MSELPDIQQNNEQILNDIQSLQQMEQKLFNSLETNPNLSTEEQQKMIEKMNQLSNMRINLYQTLSGVNNYFENAVNSSVGTLKEQAIAIEIVENELNRAKKRLEILEQERNNKIRLVEINTYFGDKYAEHSQLMKIVIFTLIPVIILAFINNKGFLPNNIYYILLVIISLIGAYFFWRRFASIIMRDNMNYQEYNWSFNPDSVSTGSSTTTDPWKSDATYGTWGGDAGFSWSRKIVNREKNMKKDWHGHEEEIMEEIKGMLDDAVNPAETVIEIPDDENITKALRAEITKEQLGMVIEHLMETIEAMIEVPEEESDSPVEKSYDEEDKEEVYKSDNEEEDAWDNEMQKCWTGYTQRGMKDKGGRMVPNCVPIEKVEDLSEADQVSKAKDKYKEVIDDRKGDPADKELYNRIIAEAKRKFDVYPSAYANGWVVQEYKRRGGKYTLKKSIWNGTFIK